MTDSPEKLQGRAITLLSAAAFASSTTARLCDPMLPVLSTGFAAPATEVAHVVSGFAVAYGICQVFFGPLGDRLGKYRLVALTTLACAVGTLWAALAGSLGMLVAARMLMGATAAGIIPLAMAWIGDTVPYERRQATLARFLSGQILGVIGGQFIGGLFTDTIGWRWAFVFICGLYLVVGMAVLRESRRNALTFHESPTGERRHAGLVSQATAVLRAPWARVILAVVFLEGVIVFGGLAFMPLYLHQRFGFSMSAAGALLGMFGIGGLSYISFARHFVRRLGEVGLAIGGSLLISVAWLLIGLGNGWAWALPASYLLGLGYYMVHNTLQTNATQMAPQVRGTALAMLPLGWIFARLLRRHHRETAAQG